MSKIMQTDGANLPVKVVQGQRVVSYKQIAELHQIDKNNLQRNFNRNKSRFIEGTDYFIIKEHRSAVDNLSTSRFYFTESGYLMLVKSLTDDLSWEVQRMLVNSYFRVTLYEQMLNYLPERTKKVIYYRSLGLTQIETGKVMGISDGTVKTIELQLRKLGYESPNQSGMRSWGMYGLKDRLLSKDGQLMRKADRAICLKHGRLEVEK